MKTVFKGIIIKSNVGFTLTELMVVIGIMAIMSAIAIPNLLNPEIKLKKASTELMADMQKTRSMAIKTNKEWGIVFDVSKNKYFITDSGTDGVWLTADDKVEKEVSFSGYAAGVKYGRYSSASEYVYDGIAVVDLSGTGGFLTFDSRGRCNINGTGSGYGGVYIQYGDITYVVVSGSTGIIKILRWVGGTEPWQ